MSIRLGASAVIVQQGSLLLVEFVDEHVGLHYNLPGGGVHDNETLKDAVRREVMEETCLAVDVERILFIVEYVPVLNNDRYGSQHKVNIIFECVPLGSGKACLPAIPDEDEQTRQIGVRWVSLEELPHVPLIPRIATRIIESISTPAHVPYILNEAL